MPRSVREYLQHILDETQYLLDQAVGLEKETFLHDETRKRAYVRSLEIIGEAAKHIPDDVRQRSGIIEWRAITGLRDRLIDGYFGVDYDIIWDVIKNKVPELHRQIADLLAQELSE